MRSMQELRELRVSLGITQEYAANILNISKDTLARAENGKNLILLSTQRKYDEFLSDCSNGKCLYPKTRGCRLYSKRRVFSTNRIHTDDTKKLFDAFRLLNLRSCDVTEVLNVNKNTFRNWEKGRQSMPKEIYDKLKAYIKAEKLRRIFGKTNQEVKP